MKYLTILIIVFTLFSCELTEDVDPADEINVDNIFTFPRTAATSLSPGQRFTLEVPEGKKVLITDVYIENLDDGFSRMRILEQTSENSFEVRYTFKTEARETLVINYTTGLLLGDERPIAGSIVLENISFSQSGILPRINGKFID